MNRPGRGQLLRISANYAQLFGSFLIGLFVVRILLGLGESVYGVIAVLVAGTGLARLLREVLQVGLLPKLADAWHRDERDGDNSNFPKVYPAALVVSAAAAGLTVIGFVLLDQALGFFDIPPALRQAASTFVWLRGLQAAISIITGPLLTMLLVREKFIAHNALIFAERALDLIAALITLAWVGVEDPARAIVTFAAIVCSGSVLLHLGATAILMVRDRRLRPHFGGINRPEIREVTASLGWNAAHALAMNLHLRLDVVIMNACFGLAAGMLFSIAGQAASYVRQITMGLVVGVDAISARHRSEEQPDQLRDLARGQMILQAAVIFPAAGALFIAAEDLLGFWLQGRLENPAASLPQIALFCRILVIGVVARSFSESWISTLTGTGNAKRIAPVVLAGALLNPILIYFGIQALPESFGRLVPAICFASIFVVVHLGLIPRIVAQFLEFPVRDLFRPAAGPALAALLGGFATLAVDASGVGPIVKLISFLAVYILAIGIFIRYQRTGKPDQGHSSSID